MIIEAIVAKLALPALSAAVTTLGSAVLGYRAQKRVAKVKKLIKERIKDREDTKSIKEKIIAVHSAITADMTPEQKADLIAKLKGLVG